MCVSRRITLPHDLDNTRSRVKSEHRADIEQYDDLDSTSGGYIDSHLGQKPAIVSIYRYDERRYASERHARHVCHGRAERRRRVAPMEVDGDSEAR